MVRKAGTSSLVRSLSSKSRSLEYTSGRYSAGSRTGSVFGEGDKPDVGSPGVEKVHQNALGAVARPVPGECWEGYNSEDFIRDEIDHTRFTINDVRENKMDEAKLVRIATEFSIPRSVGIRIPRERERASNLIGTLMAFHLVFLEIGARMPLYAYIQRSMKYPDPTFTEIGHFYWLYSYKSGGDGWWALACYDKQDGEPLIIRLLFSNKEWKKDSSLLRAIGKKTCSSVVAHRGFVGCLTSPTFRASLAVCERVLLKDFSKVERKNVSDAWLVSLE
ncbi:hypothetical protein LWI28_024075 [Acer negundo]|uniref:Uncharacterized protein n=1 Tax=Acer negundo TaxID=4023 RepID=A0AAD5IGY5_ACENE|nr:hypothetical protein LWI28_024075 [Acer negundo]